MVLVCAEYTARRTVQRDYYAILRKQDMTELKKMEKKVESVATILERKLVPTIREWLLLVDILVIADEVDAQLTEAVRSLMGTKLPQPAA